MDGGLAVQWFRVSTIRDGMIQIAEERGDLCYVAEGEAESIIVSSHLHRVLRGSATPDDKVSGPVLPSAVPT